MIEAPAARTAFITGSTGFIGLNLIERLVADGWKVIALHRGSSPVGRLDEFPMVQRAEADLLDAEAVRRALPQDVDAVFHVAGDINSWSRRNEAQTALNVGGTRNVVQAAMQRGARRFVLTSSISAYGRHESPVTETTPSNAPRSWINYERSKWQAEEIVREACGRGLEGTIVNPCAVLGPRDLHSWAAMFFAVRDGRLKALPPGGVEFNHVREVASAHVAAAGRGRVGQNYILPGEYGSFEQLFRIMAELLGVQLRARVAPSLVLRSIGRLQAAAARITGREPELTPELATLLSSSLHCATDRAERELGYRRVPMRSCVEDSFAWLRRERLL